MIRRTSRNEVVRVCLLMLLASGAVFAQEAKLAPVPRFPLSESPLGITQPAQPNRPFTVVGEHGGIFGQQDGSFELWSFPMKILRRFRITAELANYPVPIDINQQASVIHVEPDHTTITYSHAAITVKQHMFAIRGKLGQITGAIVLFQIAATRPATLTFQFDPELERAWPAPNFGRPSASWEKFGGDAGYVLNTDNPLIFGVVAMPRAGPGILPPYQERPKYYPLQFKLHFDPKTDSNLYFPLIAAVSDGTDGKNVESLAALENNVAKICADIPALYRNTEQYYSHFFDDKLTVESPDQNFNRAVSWAEIAIDQMQVKRKGETGLAAGWYSSGDSARPGFGWFFGRDTLWSLYAIDSYGDFPLARHSLEFLMKRQRADGKMMHEYSQTANLVDWASLPYEYASADATPLFVMAMEDYVRASGDVAFLRQHWDNVKRAYAFTRAHDSGGIYDNSEGTGWVESWPPGMPHQEIYLAALDEQSSEAISRMAHLLGDEKLSIAASRQAALIRTHLAEYRQKDGFYAFSRNANGTYDTTPTIFPSVTWWTGRLTLPRTENMFRRWASDEFSTDWGTRAVSSRVSFYDPINYHQGSVWPLFTGWVAMAEYRSGHPLAGYSHLMENVDLTWSQDPGAVTELLSGQYFEPLGRSTSHQMWSSAMVVSPAVRGLLGIEADVTHNDLRISPSLPVTWDHVSVHNVPFGNNRLDVDMKRRGAGLVVEVRSKMPETLCLVTSVSDTDVPCRQPAAMEHTAVIRLRPVEMSIPQSLPLPGSQTAHVKVIDEHYGRNSLALTLEAPEGSVHTVRMRVNVPSVRAHIKVEGAVRKGDDVVVAFPDGRGFQTKVVTISWEPAQRKKAR